MASLYKRNKKGIKGAGVYYVKDTQPLIVENTKGDKCFWYFDTLKEKKDKQIFRFTTGISYSKNLPNKKVADEFLKKYEQKKDDVKLQYVRSNSIPGIKRVMCSELKKRFVEFKTRTNKTEKSLLNIKLAFSEFIKYSGDKFLDEYSLDEISEFLIARIKKNGNVWSARKYKISLQSAFNWAANPSRGYLKENIWLHEDVKELTRTPKTKPDPFTPDEFAKIEAVIKNDLERDIVTFALSTGLRQGEIVHLKLSSIDLKNKIIKIESNSEHRTKSGEAREMEIADELIPIIQKYSLNGNTYLFEDGKGQRIDPNKLSKAFKNYVRMVFPNSKKHFHTLRTTFACWLFDAGVPVEKVSKYLGHSSISVTERFYADWINRKNKFQGEVNLISKIRQHAEQ